MSNVNTIYFQKSIKGTCRPVIDWKSLRSQPSPSISRMQICVTDRDADSIKMWWDIIFDHSTNSVWIKFVECQPSVLKNWCHSHALSLPRSFFKNNARFQCVLFEISYCWGKLCMRYHQGGLYSHYERCMHHHVIIIACIIPRSIRMEVVCPSVHLTPARLRHVVLARHRSLSLRVIRILCPTQRMHAIHGNAWPKQNGCSSLQLYNTHIQWGMHRLRLKSRRKSPFPTILPLIPHWIPPPIAPLPRFPLRKKKKKKIIIIMMTIKKTQSFVPVSFHESWIHSCCILLLPKRALIQ